MRRISEAMELLTAESREKAGQLEVRADAADREISELREEMRNMRLQMDTAEKTQQGSLTAGPCACGARARPPLSSSGCEWARECVRPAG